MQCNNLLSPYIFTFCGIMDIWMPIIENSFCQNGVGTETFEWGIARPPTSLLTY